MAYKIRSTLLFSEFIPGKRWETTIEAPDQNCEGNFSSFLGKQIVDSIFMHKKSIKNEKVVDGQPS